MEIQTFKEMLIALLGQYTPDLTEGLTGIAQLDWEWIASFILLLHVVILFFKCIKHIFEDIFRGWC